MEFLAEQLRHFAMTGYMPADDYAVALTHEATTNNDRDALRRIMHGNAMGGDISRVFDLADTIGPKAPPVKDQRATEVKNAAGNVVSRSKNLRALVRYAGVSLVVNVRALPCPSNPYNGSLFVWYADGATSAAHFASYVVMLDWLNARRWNGATWDIDGPDQFHIDQRTVSALERLNKKSRY